MDPISSFLSGHIAGKMMDYIQSQFKTHVIDRWSKRRAERFYEEFLREVEFELTGKKSDKLDQLLDTILKDETCSEVLFDAYRRVCLARSKDFGPRIIGIITAQIVLDKREADEIEENMLLAAENLTDSELVEFYKYIQDKIFIARNSPDKQIYFKSNGDLEINCGIEQFSGSYNSVAPMDLYDSFGRWAVKVKSYGIISDDVREKQWDYEEDTERYIDEPGTIREISWWLCMPKTYFRFLDIIERVYKGSSFDNS